MANRRKAISKKNRFEVFKRDSFTCQYCGRKAPDIVLEIDHIKPVSKGGNNGLMNLITSCIDCNRGKSNRKLSDFESLKKQMNQLEELNKRREQLKMIVEWKEQLNDLENEKARMILQLIEVDDPTSYAIDSVKKWVKKYGFEQIYDSAVISQRKYSDNGVNYVFDHIPKIAYNKKKQLEDAYYNNKNYILGIFRNRLGISKYSNKENKLRKLVNTLCTDDVTVQIMIGIARDSRYYNEVLEEIEKEFDYGC